MRADPIAPHGFSGRPAAGPAIEDERAPLILPFTVPHTRALAIVLCVAILLAAEALATRFDASVARYAAALPRGQVAVWAFITDFGTSGYMFAISASIAAAAGLARRRMQDAERRRRACVIMRAALFFFGCIAGSGIAAQAVKHLVGRLRPRFLAEAGAFDVFGPTLRRGADSFPSGHTTSAFAAAMAIGLCAPRLRVPVFVFAGVIALSRITTGNHFPSDVIAGAALGMGTSWAVAAVLARRRVLFRRSGPGAEIPFS
jgi:membrane-associated phospholipid phosphatase